MIGSSYTSREFCDGRSLASPGRWVLNARKYPDSACWLLTVHGCCSALGRIEKSPFEGEEVSALREAVVRGAKNSGHTLKTSPTD